MPYCNITTDLQDLYRGNSDFTLKREVENWTATSGQSNTYEKAFVGYTGNCWENGNKLTVKTSIAEVEAAAASWWYDSATDIIYIHPTGSGDPADFTIEIGVDHEDMLTRCRNRAMSRMDAWLNKIMITPLIEREVDDHFTGGYEEPLVTACAALTLYYAINQRDPHDEDALTLYKMAWNPEPSDDADDNEVKGIINMYLEGDLVRVDDVSPRESGNYNIFPNSSNTTAEPGIQLEGNFTGSTFQMWRITITTGGAPDGTMIWKFSDDDGTTDTRTSITSKTTGTSNLFETVSGAIKVKFTASTYTATDYWQIQLYPMDSTLEQGSKIGSITLCR